MRSLVGNTVRSLVTRERANEPLGAAMVKSTGGTGLTTADINAWLSNIFSSQQQGDLVAQYKKSVPIYFAVKLRADSVARARLKAYTVNDRGDEEWVGLTHPVQRAIDHVNPWWTHSNLWRAVETYLSLYGEAFRWVSKPSRDPATWETWVLNPSRVRIIKDPRQYIAGFIYDPHGANFPMLPDEVIWDRYFNPEDEFAGFSPLEPLKEIIAMRQDMITTNRMLFKHGVLAQNLAFLLKGSVTSDQVNEFYARLEERTSGTGNANRPIVMGQADGDVKNLGLSNREMEWMNGLRWVAGETLTALGVREELYPGSQRTTYHNLGEAERSFWRNTIAPEWAMLESNMDEQFRPMLPVRYQGLVFHFDTLTVEGMQESIDSKSARVREDVKAGILSPDEARANVWGLPPLPDGIGAKPYVPSGSTPLDTLEEKADDPPPALPEPDDDDDRGQVAEVRHSCGKLCGRNVIRGSIAYCRGCKVEFVVE